MKLRERLEQHISTAEKLADEILTALGNDMPDPKAHRRWLLTLSVEKLKARLQMVREQGDSITEARGFRIPTERRINFETCPVSDV